MRRALLAILALALVTAACSFPPGEHLGGEGALVENTTGEPLFLYAFDDDGALVRGVELELRGPTALEGPCTDRPMFAQHDDDGPVIDSWAGELCTGDYWSIPQGGVVVNETRRTIGVWATVPDGGSTYSITIEAGRTGTLRAPCADPPITAGADLFEAVPLQEPLCVGDVWLIEEP